MRADFLYDNSDGVWLNGYVGWYEMKTLLIALLLVLGSILILAQNELFIDPVMEQMIIDERFEAKKLHKEQMDALKEQRELVREQTEEMRRLREEMEDLND